MTPNVDDLKSEKERLEAQIRALKRQNSVTQLKLAMQKIDSLDVENTYLVYRACIEYVAQHRAIFKNNTKLLGKKGKRLVQ